jgi:hypothetical protein
MLISETLHNINGVKVLPDELTQDAIAFSV